MSARASSAWRPPAPVACAEDGSHYRPNHHAGSAERIYQHIEAVEAHATAPTPTQNR